MAISTLPDARSPTLAVVPATKTEIALQAQKNSIEWKGALTTEAYARRELHLAQTSICENGGLTGWILIDTASSERIALAGCESIRKRAFLSRNGVVKEVISHGIGSVFCPVEFRKRGYGARLMQELGVVLETWQTDEQHESPFSVLYSDIGKKFYATFGWTPYPSSHISFPSIKASLDDDRGKDLPHVQPLFGADLAPLCLLDEAILRNKLSSISDRTVIALIPDLPSMEWHHAREEFVSNELYGKKPFIKGASVTSESGKSRAWCIWTRMWYNEDKKSSKGNTMYILRIGVEHDETNHSLSVSGAGNGHSSTVPNNGVEHDPSVVLIEALLRVARQEAQRWQMEDVKIWNPDSTIVNAVHRIAPESKITDRESESIASVRWHGSKQENVEWVDNEKYAWC